MRELARLHSQRTCDLAISKYNLKPTNFINNHLDNLLNMYPTEARVDDLAEGEVKQL
jgi:hypothetical protein